MSDDGAALWPEEDDEYSLVMPFVCLKDSGVLDAHSFVCGVNFGSHLAEICDEHPVEWQAYVHPDMVAQYDLLAMSEGYVMESEPWDEAPDEWVLVTMKIGPGVSTPMDV